MQCLVGMLMLLHHLRYCGISSPAAIDKQCSYGGVYKQLSADAIASKIMCGQMDMYVPGYVPCLKKIICHSSSRLADMADVYQ